jgi:hypothetical protein
MDALWTSKASKEAASLNTGNVVIHNTTLAQSNHWK